MATETKATTEDVKIDLFEDDDEFEEFEINEGKSKHSRWFSQFLFQFHFVCFRYFFLLVIIFRLIYTLSLVFYLVPIYL